MKDTTIHSCFPFSHILHTTSFHLLPSLSTSSHLIHFPSSPTPLYIHFHLPTVLTPASFIIFCLFSAYISHSPDLLFHTHLPSFTFPFHPSPHLPYKSYPHLLCLLSHLPNTILTSPAQLPFPYSPTSSPLSVCLTSPDIHLHSSPTFSFHTPCPLPLIIPSTLSSSPCHPFLKHIPLQLHSSIISSHTMSTLFPLTPPSLLPQI